MLLADIVTTSEALSATRSRKLKTELLAGRLAEVDRGNARELTVVACYLSGVIRQRRTGLGWQSLRDLPPPAAEPSITAIEADDFFESVAGLHGGGSQLARAAAVQAFFAKATAAEQLWLRAAALEGVRQGALDAQLHEALAQVTEIPLAAIRRAAMLAGGTLNVVAPAVEGRAAIDAITLQVNQPILPMLASSAPSIADAWERLGGQVADGDAYPGGDARPRRIAVDTKLDGIRIQVHRDGDEVTIASRSLDDLTARLADLGDIVRTFPAKRFILDGEALALDATGRPHAFQDTAARSASLGADADALRLTPFFFDVLHVDGQDLLDEPACRRFEALESLVPEPYRVRRLVTDELATAERFGARVLADGHEGVVVKDINAPYAAGRRGAAWVKVKPVHTLDLVVLAVEWGSGRRTGTLSNIHLGARDESSPTGFVMVGKTFKGMTDEMLAWQTQRFLDLETERTAYTVKVRPEQVVEIALDGVQRSTRYAGGIALRFARVLRYRDDKTAAEADSITEIRRTFLPPRV